MGCYKNIIDSLRLCGNGDDPVDECGQVDCVCHYGERDSMCRQKVMFEAADAIEELLDELTTIRKQLPRWISVEERLPSRYETVLLNIQTCKDSYVTIGDYEPNDLRFRDFADRNNQVYCGDIVTHWMPLPAPPKVVE